MKLLSASFMALYSCAASAGLAADLRPVKSPPLRPRRYSPGTGPYIGLNTGYLLKGTTATSTSRPRICSIKRAPELARCSALERRESSGARLDGVMYGVQLGYNQQFADKFVAGFEADIQGGHAQGGGNFGSVVYRAAGAYSRPDIGGDRG